MAEMRLTGVKVELPTNTPVVFLQEVGGEGRTLPIFVGMPEASSLLQALRGQTSPRPLTYELFAQVVEVLGGSLDEVAITDLQDGIYYAELRFTVGGTSRVVDARPSDAVNLALRAGARITCDDGLLAAEGVTYDDAADDDDGEAERAATGGEPPQADELVDELKHWLENVRPEDFGS